MPNKSKKRSHKKKLLIFVAVLIILIAVSYWFFKANKDTNVKPAPINSQQNLQSATEQLDEKEREAEAETSADEAELERMIQQN